MEAMTLDPRIIYLVLMAIASALLVIAAVKFVRYRFKNEKPDANGERRRHPVIRKVLDFMPFIPIVLIGIIGGKVALDLKNQSAPPPESPAQIAYAKAATGDAAAQRRMAEMYEKGEAVTKDHTEAYFWYSLSSAAGDKDSAAKVAEIAGELNSDEVEAVSDRVKSWKPAAEAATK
jgi:heme/copper-type cytochrome/quinol oxidase subunit 2